MAVTVTGTAVTDDIFVDGSIAVTFPNADIVGVVISVSGFDGDANANGPFASQLDWDNGVSFDFTTAGIAQLSGEDECTVYYMTNTDVNWPDLDSSLAQILYIETPDASALEGYNVHIQFIEGADPDDFIGPVTTEDSDAASPISVTGAVSGDLSYAVVYEYNSSNISFNTNSQGFYSSGVNNNCALHVGWKDGESSMEWTSGGSNYDAAVAFRIKASAGGGTTHEAGLTLALEIDQSEASIATLGASITFAQSLSESISKNAVFGAAVTFAQQLEQAAGNNKIMDAGITFAQQLSDNADNSAAIDASIAFSQVVGQSQNAAAVFESAIQLSAQLGDAVAAQAILIASALYSQQLGASYAGQVSGDLEGNLVLTLNLSESTGADATLGASALFANQLTLSLVGGRSISDAVAFELTAGSSQQSDISIEGSLLVGLQAGVQQQSDAVLAAALALDAQLAVSAIAQGILNAGLSLGCIQSVTVNGSTIVAGIVTPSGRTLTVSVDTRTITPSTSLEQQ